jgi:mannose-6-phosphate isomerase-like protein (cupin superfamily)
VVILDWEVGKTVRTDAGFVRGVLWPGNGADRCTLHYASLLPGMAFPGHLHERSVDLVSVISGRGEVLTDDGVLPIRTGQSFYAPEGAMHGTRNTGDAPFVTLGTQTPPDPTIYAQWRSWAAG